MRSLQAEADEMVALHVGVDGEGPDVLVLTGGPGCVQYLEDDAITPRGFRAWYPEPRGVGRSAGGAHTMHQAVRDLEVVRRRAGIDRWLVLGHSWGSDLAVRYALDHPDSVVGVVGVAGRGPQRDATWSAAYEAGKPTEPIVEIAWDEQVHASLGASFTEWIQTPELWRQLAECPVPMRFVAAGDDIRPHWPLAQLAALVPRASLLVVPGVPHDFWSTHPEIWCEVVTEALHEVAT